MFGPLIGAGLYSIATPLTLYASAGVMAMLCAYAFLVTSKKTLTP